MLVFKLITTPLLAFTSHIFQVNVLSPKVLALCEPACQLPCAKQSKSDNVFLFIWFECVPSLSWPTHSDLSTFLIFSKGFYSFVPFVPRFDHSDVVISLVSGFCPLLLSLSPLSVEQSFGRFWWSCNQKRRFHHFHPLCFAVLGVNSFFQIVSSIVELNAVQWLLVGIATCFGLHL